MKIARYLIYPGLVGGALVAAVAGLAADLPGPLLLPLISAAVFGAVALAERWLPYEEAWRRSRGDVGTDLAGLLLSVTLAGGCGQGLALWGLSGVSSWMGAWAGGWWPAGWPLGLQVALGLVLGEFGNYWLHRAQHEQGGWLWALHAPHHSAERLYWLNGNRIHPGDAFLSALLITAPLALLGAPEPVLVLVGVYSAAHLALQHANIDYRVGPLNWVLSVAEVHRWHHAKDLSLANANYGAVLLIWDVIWGTRRLPPGRPPVEVGLSGDPNYPCTYWGQLSAPWRR